MTLLLIVIQLIVTAALVGVILLQRSEGGALGIGGGPGGMMSGRSAGDALTRATSILAVVFFASSLLLTLSVAMDHRDAGVLDRAGTFDPNLEPPQDLDFNAPGAPLEDATPQDEAPAEPEPREDDAPDRGPVPL